MPLPKEKIRALSLEHHLALATVLAGRGHLDQVSCLVRVLYLATFLRGTTLAETDLASYRSAEKALNACVARVDQGMHCQLSDLESDNIGRILLTHDDQLDSITWHQYLSAWERLRHYISTGQRSPIAVAMSNEQQS
ncbi:hypothetical protein WS90_31925 [Burkholderia cepacia]|uniref:Fis family transcriptional regulator n=2 Tax=Burkholderia cepacia TaxID=292 RepID=A0A103Z4J6_BURCE|nr:hypothetical protein WS90_31925 [Burkholderia cepacia]